MTPKPPPWHALHYLPENAEAVLDIGCNDGAALQHARELGAKKLFGIEINPQAAELARKRLGAEECQIFHASADEIPLADQCADAAICSEVLEHIPSELRAKAVAEVHRVLKPGAPWIITTPAVGLFSFLDPANARLRFPALFGRVSRVLGGSGREAGYENQKHGIVWHHHFSIKELRGLLSPQFRIEVIRYRGALLSPLCNWLEFPFYRRQAYDSRALKLIQKLHAWEMSRDPGEKLAYNVLLVARKPVKTHTS